MHHLEPRFIYLFLKVYERFVGVYGRPANVLYPGCGCDISPSLVFYDVVYVDREKFYVNVLKEKGLDARCQDVHTFEPDRDFDLLLVMRFHLTPEDLRRFLKKGHMICDYYQAGDTYDNPDFKFIEDMENLGKSFDRNGAGYYLFRRR